MNDEASLYCRICGERGNTVPYSLKNKHHKYGPKLTHNFMGVEYSQLPKHLKEKILKGGK